MIVAVFLALLLGLSVLRYVLEPTCPGCTAKSWNCQGTAELACARCGWSSTAPASAGTKEQYELCLP